MKLDRLVQLEKRLARVLDRRLRDPAAPHDVLELVPLILDHVEEHVLPTADGGRIFPYDRITVQVAVTPEGAAAARAVLEHPPGLEQRVRERLRDVDCVAPAELKVSTRIVEGSRPDSWGEQPFRIEYRERKQRREPPGRNAALPSVRLVVTSGAAGARTQEFELERINLGRMQRVEGYSRSAVRHNHLAFADDGSEVNSTVSRAHAHIRHDRDAGVFLLFDDGSVHGTRVLRAGRALAVPRQGSRGVKLEDGDELELGSARVRFITHAPRPREGSRRRGT
jgi:FHA domain-containing protein